MINPTGAWVLLGLSCPVLPAGSSAHAVVCEPEPVRVFSTFDLCFEAKQDLKARGGGSDTFAVCLDRSQLHSAEWTRGDGGSVGTYE